MLTDKELAEKQTKCLQKKKDIQLMKGEDRDLEM